MEVMMVVQAARFFMWALSISEHHPLSPYRCRCFPCDGPIFFHVVETVFHACPGSAVAAPVLAVGPLPCYPHALYGSTARITDTDRSGMPCCSHGEGGASANHSSRHSGAGFGASGHGRSEVRRGSPASRSNGPAAGMTTGHRKANANRLAGKVHSCTGCVRCGSTSGVMGGIHGARCGCTGDCAGRRNGDVEDLIARRVELEAACSSIVPTPLPPS